MSAVEVRCPVDSRRLFARIRDAKIVEGNLLEFACDDCKKTLRRMGEPVARVLHTYDVLGQHIDTEVVRSG